MISLVSICIPTYRRLNLLQVAVQSCFEQGHRPLEILIGDDSDDQITSDWVGSLTMPEDITLRYEQNRTQLGQAANLNRLFSRALGDRVMVLHDDDLLCQRGLDVLVDAWDAHPGARCVYGVQVLVDPVGNVLAKETALWSQRYNRLPDRAGPQENALVAALWQQVPNDGYLIETALAQQICLRPETEIGQCVDAEFIIRASHICPARSFIFVCERVSQYRLTPQSIARATDLNRRQDLLYGIVEEITGDRAVTDARDIILERISIGAALDAAMKQCRREALTIIFSRYYTAPFLSSATLYRLACVVSPRLATMIKAKIRHAPTPLALRESTIMKPPLPQVPATLRAHASSSETAT